MFSRGLKALKKRIKYLGDYVMFIKFRRRLEKNFLSLADSIGENDKCVIVANGPSLRDTDLSKYEDYKFITMNRAYVKWDDLIGGRPFAHVCINSLVLEEFKDDLLNLECPCFYNFSPLKNDFALESKYINPILMGFFIGDRISNSINQPMSSGGTVTFVALNIAILCGFKEIVIVGLDHNFSDVGQANKTVSMKGDDMNHFFPDYFPKGMKWELPDLQRSENGYQVILRHCEHHGIKISNKSTFSKCTVFPMI